MRISHEAIYQALYVQGRGALQRELVACLRTGRALRVPRARTRGRGKKFVTTEIMISERPAEAADRAVPGHWEGDLIIGLNSSAIGTLVERTTRFTMLLHLPPMEGHGGPRAKNGPALAGHGAEAVRDAIAATITTLPEQLRRSLTWDQGAEMAQHAQLRIEHRPGDLLLRPPQPLAARQQREHQRPAAPVLPQGHRPQPRTAQTTWPPSPPRSTAAPARPSAGRRQPRPSTNSYTRPSKPVLRRPLEPKEYTARLFRAACQRLGVTQSMGRPGSALDNAVIESWHSTLEFELRSVEHFATRAAARAKVAAWIEDYNTHRRHSACQMMSPVNYERALAAGEAA